MVCNYGSCMFARYQLSGDNAKSRFDAKMAAGIYYSRPWIVEKTIAYIMESKGSVAAFVNKESLDTYPKYWCAVEAPWVSEFPLMLSMAFAKESPYYPFLHYK